MDFDRFLRANDDLSLRLSDLKECEPHHHLPTRDCMAEATSALDIAMDQLRAAESCIRGQEEEIRIARLIAEAERRRYHDLFEGAPVAYLVTNTSGRIEEANRAAAKLLGGSPGEMTGRSLADSLAESDRPAFRRELDRLARQGNSRDWEAELAGADGEPVRVSLRASAVSDRTAEPFAYRWIVREVAPGPTATDRLQVLGAGRDPAVGPGRGPDDDPTARAEAESARLVAMLDGIDAIFWEAGPDGRLRFINRRAEEMLGYPARHWMAGADFCHEIVHADDRDWVAAHRRRCFGQGLDGELEYRVVTADARVVWLRESVRVARDEKGRVGAIRGAMWNVGRRKKVERQLYVVRRELANELADMTYLHELGARLWETPEPGPLLEAILTAAAAIVGAEMGLIRLYDPARRDLETVASTGLSDPFIEQFGRITADISLCGRALDRGAALIVEDLRTDPESTAEDREVARVGGFRGVHVTPLIGRGGEPLGTIVTCFRDRHRPADRQSHLLAMFARQAADFVENSRLRWRLREADRRKDDALTTLARRLSNPISTILHAAQAPSRPDGDGRDLGEVLDLIRRQARKMIHLVDALLDPPRIETGEVEVCPEWADLGAIAAEPVMAVRPIIEIPRRSPKVSAQGRLDLQAKSSPIRVGHAGKFTPALARGGADTPA